MIPEHTKGPEETSFQTEKCVVAVSLTALIAVTMKQFNALICNGIGKKQEKYESKV
jgi:hypothetical protein